jgi:hypothetical protein
MKNNINLNTPSAQQMITTATTGCNAIASGTIRTARQHCGSTYWDALSVPEQIQAGQIISAAIDAGMLPLEKLEKSPSNHRRYQRK